MQPTSVKASKLVVLLVLMQVIVVALVMSFVIKRDSEVVDYEDAFGEMKTVDDVTVTDPNTYGTLIGRSRSSVQLVHS